MKILVIGGSGTIGKKVVKFLKQKHEVLIGGRNSGDVKIDLEDIHSIEKALSSISELDAIVNISGEAKWDKFDNLTEDDFYIGIKSKLMGQVNLVRIGNKFLNKGGSFTLTTGILADDPVDMTTSAAMVNGAINSFVKAVALELENHRINVVSAGLVEDAFEKYKDYFPGHDPVPMQKVINGYVKSIEGKINGEIIKVNA
ncbi:short chain dehydrogenase [Aureisphaera sp. CAU 1614]|uniref:Short chain dehydrogenase n=1 Tax=Halomarinibacterium sedimenti TaxID=2857106 RepID=A0A9X1FR64_9FLAO|nr:short chain dehydrogenase [Halomarinibacterium sedimenti]MBW2938843.1 short chain dehydrogenase [Halomarinibacterium sedimenti]